MTGASPAAGTGLLFWWSRWRESAPLQVFAESSALRSVSVTKLCSGRVKQNLNEIALKRMPIQRW